ncbi:MAG: cell division protein FtsZ [Candidatus Diapherotrites archaeon]|nr:cell division protein FtsZ [Candidatus Diapherotrites archaeon]
MIKNAVKVAKQRASAKKPKRTKSYSDKELQDILSTAQAKIKVVGTGGSGNNTLLRLNEVGVEGAEVIAMNTDAQHLIVTPADKKLLLGKGVTRGLGAGSDPELGEAATKESIPDITKILSGADMVFVTCGLGGGTGTGSAPIIAQVAKDQGALTVGVVTLPFSVEGRRRMENALSGLKKLRKEADTVIVIPNDKLLEIVPDLPINAAFKVADEILVNAVKGITELITKPGLVNLDFADVRAVLSNGGAAMIGLGESELEGDSEGRALEAVEDALNSPLLDIDVSEATRALVNVSGGADMTLREAEMIVEAVASKIHSNAHIIWGAMIDEEMKRNRLQAMVVIAGGKFPYLDEKRLLEQTEEIDIDVEYVE